MLNLLTLLSLLLCAAVVVLWVRSHSVGDRWNGRPGAVTAVTTSPFGETDNWRVQYQFNSGRGLVQVVRKEFQGGPDPSTRPGRSTVALSMVIAEFRRGAEPGDRSFGALGFEYFVRGRRYSSDSQMESTVWVF